MAFRKRTLRVMSPTARKVARLIGEQESVAKRLKNLIPDLQRLDFESRALQTAKSGLTLSDTDAWGLECALHYAIDQGYLGENNDWAEGILKRIGDFRDQFRAEKVEPREVEDLPDILTYESTGIPRP